MPPIDWRKNAWISILCAYEVLYKEINKSMVAAGCVDLATYDALLHLEEAGSSGVDMGTLSDRVLLSISGVSRLVARLERDGLVSVCRSAENHRVKLVRATEKGLQARVAAWEVYRGLIDQHVGLVIDDREAEQVAQILGRVVPSCALVGWSGPKPQIKCQEGQGGG
ncbi:MAG: winged helix-turn-helix transcriptional regulator [Armatimonadetes bacterium]|nr:winged helix-turn-helix transcriptional regulator [Armatimonadota bacterium]MBS1711167.1 winged helix-turn-helix transcriptional regulator [Armatimonadota bacterium]MBX3108841.1 winged helix-turn-helix transcriptional regulator [Fimbriimonadaceae bacterium]